MRLQIELGELLFQFSSFRDWKDNACVRFRKHKAVGVSVAIDTMGRICLTGREFMRADEDGAFPVSVYSIDVSKICEVPDS